MTDSDDFFDRRFARLTTNAPFPWQRELFRRFLGNPEQWPTTCNLPTGVGKTWVIAIWLLALAWSAKNGNGSLRIPRRLVYVVNRRTVVDQASDEARKLREALRRADSPELADLRETLMGLCAIVPKDAKVDFVPLAISTLRGQFADNREWSADPARPAIIVGTVDMIGSRLLFSGYRCGFKSKPLHAGFLGQDALLVHDEAHLEPAFQKLIERIQFEQHECERTGELPWPKLRVMALSATVRAGSDGPDGNGVASFGLTDEEKQPPAALPDPPTKPIHHVWKRLKARKALHLHSCADEKKSLAEDIANRALALKESGRAIVVFARFVIDVEKVVSLLEKGKQKGKVEQLTGTIRGKERDELVRRPVFQRFLAESDRDKDVVPEPGTVYLVCTSAGEVGVNISADHLVCDLTTFESIAQRFGRVNRFGQRDDSEIHVVFPASFGPEEKIDELDRRRRHTLELLRRLPGNAGPTSLDALPPQDRLAAFSPEPTTLPATDILFDAWALTTIREKLPGRPPVEAYLHGVSEWQPPETHVAWREEVERITSELIERHKPKRLSEDLLEDFPLKPHELLRDRSDRVVGELQAIHKRHADSPLWIVEQRGQVEVTTLATLLAADKKAVVNRIAWRTLLLPPSAGGLSEQGTLVGKIAFDPDRATRYDVSTEWTVKATVKGEEIDLPGRWRGWDDDSPPDGNGWRMIRDLDTKPDAEEAESEEPETKRFWRWYELRKAGDSDGSRWSSKPVLWDVHTSDALNHAQEIVDKLALPDDLTRAVVLAATWHDLGKQRALFQRILGNVDPSVVLSKSGKRNGRIAENYRHEFGSLLDAEREADFRSLDSHLRDVVLHLIAAHHGRARPHFPVDPSSDPLLDETFDPECDLDATTAAAIEVPRRFARLQRRYGRWGLAYLESLLRAADWAASAEPSEFYEPKRKA